MSLRTRIIRSLVGVVMSGWSKGTIAAQRARQARAARFTRIPADVVCRPVDADGVPCEWIVSSEAASDPVSGMIYLHGGAYALGSIDVFRPFLARLARATGTRVLAVDYRLAPEHPYPAALEDAVTAYRWALDAAGSAPSQVLVAGDSAGGGLALAALLALRDTGAPLPARAVCLSPWLDLALTGASVRGNARVDPILSYEALDGYACLYAGAHDRTSPLISPLYADLRDLPPLLIQVGTEEILLDDAVRCADRARAAGVAVTLDVVDGMFHVFQMVGALPETQAALREIAAFQKRFVALCI